jgi:hypothetical protein
LVVLIAPRTTPLVPKMLTLPAPGLVMLIGPVKV